MKKQGILNSSISKVLSDLGHTDLIVIADAGLPVPAGVPKIDIALLPGLPDFRQTVSAVAADMVIEKVILAEEILHNNAEADKFIKETLPDSEAEYVSHEAFKTITKEAKAIIRTGEVTPYANAILQAGVFF